MKECMPKFKDETTVIIVSLIVCFKNRRHLGMPVDVKAKSSYACMILHHRLDMFTPGLDQL